MSTDIPQLRTGAFVEAKFYCPHADATIVHSDHEEDTIILSSSVVSPASSE